MWFLDKKCLMIISITTIIIVALANLELFINKTKSIVKISIPKNNDIVILNPNETGERKAIYVYNSKYVNDKNVNVLRGINVEEYDIQMIHEHIASKIYTALNNIYSTIKNVPFSSTPMNDMFRTICYGSDLINTVDPLVASNITNYRIMKPKGSQITAFIDDGYIYIR